MTVLPSILRKAIEYLLRTVEFPSLLGFPYGLVRETELAAQVAPDLCGTRRASIEPQWPAQLNVLPAVTVHDHFFSGRRQFERTVPLSLAIFSIEDSVLSIHELSSDAFYDAT